MRQLWENEHLFPIKLSFSEDFNRMRSSYQNSHCLLWGNAIFGKTVYPFLHIISLTFLNSPLSESMVTDYPSVLAIHSDARWSTYDLHTWRHTLWHRRWSQTQNQATRKLALLLVVSIPTLGARNKWFDRWFAMCPCLRVPRSHALNEWRQNYCTSRRCVMKLRAPITSRTACLWIGFSHARSLDRNTSQSWVESWTSWFPLFCIENESIPLKCTASITQWLSTQPN